MKAIERESNTELLRLVLMFMVVIVHFFGAGIGARPENKLFLYGVFVSSFVICAVNSYVFISGYYGIKFKIKGVVSLLVQIFFYSILILLISILLGYPVEIKDIIKSVLPLSSKMWWFVSVFLILYCLSPVFNIAISNFSKKQHLLICIFLLFVNCCYGFIFSNFTGYSIVPFISIYFVARYFNIYNVKIKYPFILFVAFCLCLFFSIVFVNAYVKDNDTITFIGVRLMDYNNPLIIGASICLFYVFNKLRVKSSIINKLSTYSLGVYLIHNHPFIWKYICVDRIIEPIKVKYDGWALIFSLIISAMIVYVVCLLFDFIRLKITTPLANGITHFFEKKWISFNAEEVK